jgi:hypothetical protein
MSGMGFGVADMLQVLNVKKVCESVVFCCGSDTKKRNVPSHAAYGFWQNVALWRKFYWSG